MGFVGGKLLQPGTQSEEDGSHKGALAHLFSCFYLLLHFEIINREQRLSELSEGKESSQY